MNAFITNVSESNNTKYSKISSIRIILLGCLLLLLIVSFFGVVECQKHQTRINYQGEHSNYGDHAKIKQHITEHLKDVQHPPDMSETDELYYLFTIHDINKDRYLDGHELREAFTDFNLDNEDPKAILTISELNEMIDHVLLEDDMDNE
ncbi:4436_t:CDS:2 [Ambispora gerdemannii]|uniref:4436_t:CDS:1 n=1 Tax=Ambispora gerdemannii TaxID=144530 RepID=A0A9N9FEL3_9GLOM|nr:4436_t:CDS:2 [Ambispora gerdemannii]